MSDQPLNRPATPMLRQIQDRPGVKEMLLGVPVSLKAVGALFGLVGLAVMAGIGFLVVDGRLDAVNDYLGLTLAGDVAVPDEHRRVVRTRGYDNWRRWFTEEDVAFFRPIISEFLDTMGYDADDWALTPVEQLSAEEGSAYMKSLRENRPRLPARSLLRRVATTKTALLKAHHALRTLGMRNDLRQLRGVLARLKADPQLLAYHEGRSDELPGFYHQLYRQKLGRYSELISEDEMRPVLEPPSPAVPARSTAPLVPLGSPASGHPAGVPASGP